MNRRLLTAPNYWIVSAIVIIAAAASCTQSAVTGTLGAGGGSANGGSDGSGGSGNGDVGGSSSSSDESGGSANEGGSASQGGSASEGGRSAAVGGTSATSASSSAKGGSSSGAGGSAAGGKTGSGGTSSSSSSAKGGAATGGATTAASTSNPNSKLMKGTQSGSGSASAQYQTVTDIKRDNVPYVLITNGWGPGWQNHSISWLGTSFTVVSLNGKAGSGGEPAGYPAVFCGKYSVPQTASGCGLPAQISSIKKLMTGWKWDPNGSKGQYNAAYDIWLGDGNNLQSYFMVWLHDPSNYQPAGTRSASNQGVRVTNAPGQWNVWTGTVNGKPIINYVRTEGDDLLEIEFDVLDFLNDAKTRNLNPQGASVNAVAVGFEIWDGPITNLKSLDFYVEVTK